MKIIKRTNDDYVVEMSRYEMALVLGYDAIYQENDTIVLTKQLTEYHELRQSIERLASIMKLEKRS